MPVYIDPATLPPAVEDLQRPLSLENYLRKQGLEEIIPLVQSLHFEDGYQFVEFLRDEGYVCPPSWQKRLGGSGLTTENIDTYRDLILGTQNGRDEVVGGEKADEKYISKLPFASPRDALEHMKRVLIDDYYGKTRKFIDDGLIATTPFHGTEIPGVIVLLLAAYTQGMENGRSAGEIMMNLVRTMRQWVGLPTDEAVKLAREFFLSCHKAIVTSLALPTDGPSTNLSISLSLRNGLTESQWQEATRLLQTADVTDKLLNALSEEREKVIAAQRRVASFSRPADLAHLIHTFSADINDVHWIYDQLKIPKNTATGAYLVDEIETKLGSLWNMSKILTDLNKHLPKPEGVHASTWALCVSIALEKKRIALKEVGFSALYIGGSIAAVVAGAAVAGPVGGMVAGSVVAGVIGGVDVYKAQTKLTDITTANTAHRLSGLPLANADHVKLIERERDYAAGAAVGNVALAAIGGGVSQSVIRGGALSQFGLETLYGAADGLASAAIDDRVVNEDFLRDSLSLSGGDPSQAHELASSGLIISAAIGGGFGGATQLVVGARNVGAVSTVMDTDSLSARVLDKTEQVMSQRLKRASQINPQKTTFLLRDDKTGEIGTYSGDYPRDGAHFTLAMDENGRINRVDKSKIQSTARPRGQSVAGIYQPGQGLDLHVKLGLLDEAYQRGECERMVYLKDENHEILFRLKITHAQKGENHAMGDFNITSEMIEGHGGSNNLSTDFSDSLSYFVKRRNAEERFALRRRYDGDMIADAETAQRTARLNPLSSCSQEYARYLMVKDMLRSTTWVSPSDTRFTQAQRFMKEVETRHVPLKISFEVASVLEENFPSETIDSMLTIIRQPGFNPQRIKYLVEMLNQKTPSATQVFSERLNDGGVVELRFVDKKYGAPSVRGQSLVRVPDSELADIGEDLAQTVKIERRRLHNLYHIPGDVEVADMIPKGFTTEAIDTKWRLNSESGEIERDWYQFQMDLYKLLEQYDAPRHFIYARGSRINGTPRPDSDFDVSSLVSPDDYLVIAQEKLARTTSLGMREVAMRDIGLTSEGEFDPDHEKRMMSAFHIPADLNLPTFEWAMRQLGNAYNLKLNFAIIPENSLMFNGVIRVFDDVGEVLAAQAAAK